VRRREGAPEWRARGTADLRRGRSDAGLTQVTQLDHSHAMAVRLGQRGEAEAGEAGPAPRPGPTQQAAPLA